MIKFTNNLFLVKNFFNKILDNLLKFFSVILIPIPSPDSSFHQLIALSSTDYVNT